MESSPAAAASSRPSDSLLVGNFDLPASWGCRKRRAFCRDPDTDTDDAPAAANPTAAEGGKDSGLRSQEIAAAQQAPVVGDEAQHQQEAPRWRHRNLRERTSTWRDYRAEDARPARKLWSTAAAAAGGFSVALTRQEIDADFVAITGRKAPRRPRKRARSVQGKIETLWPGSSLTEVNRDRYKVNEKAKVLL